MMKASVGQNRDMFMVPVVVTAPVLGVLICAAAGMFLNFMHRSTILMSWIALSSTQLLYLKEYVLSRFVMLKLQLWWFPARILYDQRLYLHFLGFSILYFFFIQTASTVILISHSCFQSKG